MREMLYIDEAQIQRLPLPLAQLLRRAHNAKTPLERHHAAYYLWEASLKLQASVAIVEYAEQPQRHPELLESLENLARPSTGHWWEFIRRLLPVLAESGDSGFAAARDFVLGKSRDDLARAAGLDAALSEVLEGRGGARVSVRLTELFNRLVTYRNREFGHGAGAQRPAEFHDRMARFLLAGVTQILDRVDVLASRKLLYVGEVRRQPKGDWLVELQELVGEAPRRLESLEIPDHAAPTLPRPETVCIASNFHSVGPTSLHALHPLIRFDTTSSGVFFLNSRRGKQQSEYLCYSTGVVLKCEDVAADHRELLAHVLGQPMKPDDVSAFAAKSYSEEVPPSPEEAAAAPRILGEFELLSRLGQGGMGVVYRAWQPSLARQVALKCMLRAGDSRAEARFLREIRALGRVEHPNLVRVFTSGAEGDQWFYAMELIEGAELSRVSDVLVGSETAMLDDTAWRSAVRTAMSHCRSAEKPLTASHADASPAPQPAEAAAKLSLPIEGNLPSGGRKGRSYVEHVVEIIRQITLAAHALHEAGVVHRDIKPGNIMLASDEQHPVLMDLGLAQLADGTEGRATRTRQFVGTLRYASPEQILSAGKVDRRSDVYSLGATLWELLTLRPIFDISENTPTPDLMLRIQTTDVAAVRKYNTSVSRDLEMIVLKCLEKSPDRRYQTARELADDLHRWQAGDPVLAQPPSMGYLTWKFVRRYRGSLATVAGIFLLAIVGTVAAFINLHREQSHTKQALETAQQNLSIAERRQKALEEVMQSLNAVKNRAGSQDAYALVLDETIASLERTLAEDRHSPEVKAALAARLADLGEIRMGLGQFDEARHTLAKAVEYQRDLLAIDQEDVAVRQKLADYVFLQGQLISYEQPSEKWELAKPFFQESVQCYEILFAISPANAAYQAGLGRALVRLALTSKDIDEALCLRGRELTLNALKHSSEDASAWRDLATCLNSLTFCPTALNDAALRIDYFAQAREASQRALAANPTMFGAQRVLATTTRNLAIETINVGRVDEAVQTLQRGMSEAKQFSSANPNLFVVYDPQLQMQKKLAEAYQQQGKLDDAVAEWNAIADTCANLIVRFPREVKFAVENLAAVQSAAGIHKSNSRLRAAEALLDRALSSLPELLPQYKNAPSLLEQSLKISNDRAQIASDAERSEEALSFYRDALKIFEAATPPDNREWDNAAYQYIQIARNAINTVGEGDTDAVIELGERANFYGERLGPSIDPENWLGILCSLGKAYSRQKRSEDAERVFLRAYGASQKRLEAFPFDWYSHTDYRVAVQGLATLYRDIERPSDELRYLRLYLTDATYMDGKSRDALLSETSELTDENLATLRSELDNFLGKSFKRFTIPTDFSGVKYPFHVYVSEAYQPLQDQFRWVSEFRGGKVPQEIVDSFERLSKIAVENNVSYMDLCIYALGTANAGEEGGESVDQLLGRVVELKRGLDGADNETKKALRRQLAETTLKLARGQFKASNLAKAQQLALEVSGYVDRDDQGTVIDFTQRATLADATLINGRCLLTLSGPEEALSVLTASVPALRPSENDDAWYGTYMELFGDVCSKLNRVNEAAMWYWNGAAAGSLECVSKLAEIYVTSPQATTILPAEFHLLIRSNPVLEREKAASQLKSAWRQHQVELVGSYQAAAKALLAAEKHDLATRECEHALRVWTRLRRGYPEDQSIIDGWSDTLLTSGTAKAGLGLTNVAADFTAKAEQLRAQGDQLGSITLLKVAAELEPKEPARWIALGYAWTKMRKWSQGADAYRKSLALAPLAEADFNTVTGLMEALTISGKADEACQIAESLRRENWMTAGKRKDWLILFQSLETIARLASGQAADEIEEAVNQALTTPDSRPTFWTWVDVEAWLKDADLLPERKDKINQFLSGIKAPASEPTSASDAKPVVLLLHGKNSTGDQIYAYLRIGLDGLDKLKTAVAKGIINLADFGEVVAHGQGEPTPETMAEIKRKYDSSEQKLSANSAAADGATDPNAELSKGEAPDTIEVSLEELKTAISRTGKVSFGELFKDDYVIIFLSGANDKGMKVYAYVKVDMPKIDEFSKVLQSNKNFNPSDYGEIVAAGEGEPSDEVKKELASKYPLFENPKPLNLKK